MLAADLRRTLAMVSAALAEAQDDWWIIGSAAVALHAADPVDVADVDMLTSEADARRLCTILDLEPKAGGPDALFRSTLFATWTAPPFPVEIMAGFAVRSDTIWDPVRLSTRVPIDIDGHRLYMPDRVELIALLHRFGRPKDRARAALLA